VLQRNKTKTFSVVTETDCPKLNMLCLHRASDELAVVR